MSRPAVEILQFAMVSRSSAGLRRSTALIIAVTAGFTIAHIPGTTIPLQIGALIDGAHRTAAEAGFLGFCELGSLAIAMILISPRVDRIVPWGLAMFGAVLAGLGNLILLSAHGLPVQILGAASVGAGCGITFAATITGGAATPNPDRCYAIGTGLALVALLGIMMGLPLAAARFGSSGVFPALAAAMMLSLPFLVGLRSGTRLPGVKLSAWRTPGAPSLLFVSAAYAIGAGATYAFSERLGRAIALPPLQMGQVLSIGPVLGLLGSVAAAFVNGRVRRSYAFAGSLAGCAFACLLLSFSTSLAAFTAGIWLFWFTNIFFYVYMLGTAAVLDPSGRLATLTGGIERLSYGAGAWLGGTIVEHAGYSAGGLIGFVGCSLGVVLGAPFVFRAVRLRGR